MLHQCRSLPSLVCKLECARARAHVGTFPSQVRFPVRIVCLVCLSQRHVIFGSLHIAVLMLFLCGSKHAPQLLRGLVIGAGIISVLLRVLLGGTCSLRSAHTADELVYGLQFVSSVQLVSAVAMSLVRYKSEGAVLPPKLALLGALSLANLFAGIRWLMHDHPEDTVRALMLSSALLGLSSLVFLYRTKSRMVAGVLCLAPLLMVVFGIVSAAFPIDRQGRLVPRGPDDDEVATNA